VCGERHREGIQHHTIGLILMIVGIVGLLISVLWMTVWADRRNRVATVDRRDGVAARETELP
jgi:hypothetical protein